MQRLPVPLLKESLALHSILEPPITRDIEVWIEGIPTPTLWYGWPFDRAEPAPLPSPAWVTTYEWGDWAARLAIEGGLRFSGWAAGWW